MNTSRAAGLVSSPVTGCTVDRRSTRWFVPYKQDPPADDIAR